jgi:3-hydroxyisobutyrate dehydrogenase-like beta-hydroxyacid dehydrogenase
MANATIALLNPGNMGATIGAAAATSGARVLWCSQGRSTASRKRAEQAGLQDAENIAAAVTQSDIVLSVCPPEAAPSVAKSVAKENFKGVYVDANAVSRATAEQIGAIVTGAGASFVDGGIIGSPVTKAGTTRMYLSGARAREIAALFAQSMLDARAISETPGEASALKVAYAAWTKGTDALILAIRAYAQYEGVDRALLEEWKISQPTLETKTVRAAANAAPKMWRYVGEMEEIAQAFKVAGLPSGFHDGAARLSERLACFKDMTDPPLPVEKVIGELLRQK